MAIPEKPLKLSFDPDELLVTELEMIEGRKGISASAFLDFLRGYSNWTADEIKNLRRKDILDVWILMREQVLGALVPKVSETL